MAARYHADVHISDCYDELDVEIVAPAGHHWACDALHALVGHQNDDATRAVEWWCVDEVRGGRTKLIARGVSSIYELRAIALSLEDAPCQ